MFTPSCLSPVLPKIVVTSPTICQAHLGESKMKKYTTCPCVLIVRKVKQPHLQLQHNRSTIWSLLDGQGKNGLFRYSQEPVQVCLSIPSTQGRSEYLLCVAHGMKHVFKSVRNILWSEHVGGEREKMSLEFDRDSLKCSFNHDSRGFVLVFKVSEQTFSYFCSSLMLMK